MKKLLIPVFAAILPVLMTGCLFPSGNYNEVVYYDLSTIRLAMPDNLPVVVEIFQSSESSRSQMTYLTSDNRLQLDSYNRWVQQPEYIITRFLQTAFSNNQPSIQTSTSAAVAGRRAMADGYRISGTVFTMRIDLKRREAILGVNYLIRSIVDGASAATLSNSSVYTAKYRNESPADFAAAMSEAAEKMAMQIQSEISQLHNPKGTSTNVKAPVSPENPGID